MSNVREVFGIGPCPDAESWLSIPGLLFGTEDEAKQYIEKYIRWLSWDEPLSVVVKRHVLFADGFYYLLQKETPVEVQSLSEIVFRHGIK